MYARVRIRVRERSCTCFNSYFFLIALINISSSQLAHYELRLQMGECRLYAFESVMTSYSWSLITYSHRIQSTLPVHKILILHISMRKFKHWRKKNHSMTVDWNFKCIRFYWLAVIGVYRSLLRVLILTLNCIKYEIESLNWSSNFQISDQYMQSTLIKQ